MRGACGRGRGHRNILTGCPTGWSFTLVSPEDMPIASEWSRTSWPPLEAPLDPPLEERARPPGDGRRPSKSGVRGILGSGIFHATRVPVVRGTRIEELGVRTGVGGRGEGGREGRAPSREESSREKDEVGSWKVVGMLSRGIASAASPGRGRRICMVIGIESPFGGRIF